MCRADFLIEPDTARRLHGYAFGALLDLERGVLLLPAALVDTLHARFIGSASGLVSYARVYQDDLAARLNLPSGEVADKLGELIKLLKGHVPDDLLEAPTLFDVKFIQADIPRPRPE